MKKRVKIVVNGSNNLILSNSSILKGNAMYMKVVTKVVASFLLMGLFFSPQHVEAVGLGLERLNIITGALTDGPFNPVFNGGDFDGVTLYDARSSVIGMIDTAGFQVNLLGANGISRYDLVTGNLTTVNNPTLDAGGTSEYADVLLSDMDATNIVGMIDSFASASFGFQVNVLGPNGITRYGLETGNFADTFNPIVSGSTTVYNGQRFSDVNPRDILGMIDSHPFQVQLVDATPVPEPATATLGLLALAGLVRRRRRAA